jgi:hypothetical protein
MADTTKFGHDQLGHILADYLLEVPRFQREFSWDERNVTEYLGDLAEARRKNVDYFMGTVVFARPEAEDGRRQIVDGQQRLATTAVLLIAVRDLLHEYGRSRQADEVEKRFLRGYVISADDDVERLILSAPDIPSYTALLDHAVERLAEGDLLRKAYVECVDHLRKLSPTAKDSRRLVEVATQLEERVQVLVAEASDLPEAYVIFETLNDRGADLTTADLLKNYLFSASKQYFPYVEASWLMLSAGFEKADDLVKFIRYEYVSRRGTTASRKLYRAIQADVGTTPRAVKEYVERLLRAQAVYLAIRDPEDSFWAGVSVEVRDALYAYRRFGFEASIPVVLAAFGTWSKADASRLMVKIATWSVRAQFGGRLGGGVAEESFGEAAVGISDGTFKNQSAVRGALSRLIPSDAEFRAAFTSYGDVAVARAKYLLAMLEKACDEAAGRPVRALEWYSRSVTVEHVLSLSAAKSNEASAAVVNRLGNLALLEKKLNRGAGSRPFAQKREIYRASGYELTKRLARRRTWGPRSVQGRMEDLADLACRAWPAD